MTGKILLLSQTAFAPMILGKLLLLTILVFSRAQSDISVLSMRAAIRQPARSFNVRDTRPTPGNSEKADGID